MRASWNGAVLADSDRTRVVEGNHYFPPDSVNWDALPPSNHTSWCFWKGRASYFHLSSEDGTTPNAA